jgi:hypothetical protein
LKKAVRDLFDELERLDKGTVVRLEFKRGLPCLLETAVAAIGDSPILAVALDGSQSLRSSLAPWPASPDAIRGVQRRLPTDPRSGPVHRDPR